MADRYLLFARTSVGSFLTRRLGLPRPGRLLRSDSHPRLDGQILRLTAGGPGLGGALDPVLRTTGLKVRTDASNALDGGRIAAVVLDATDAADMDDLVAVHAALRPVVRQVAESGRIMVLGAPPDPHRHRQSAVQQALEGFVRSLAKEIGRGRTVSLVRMSGAADTVGSTVRFLLSPRSAYVSGQVIEVADTALGDGSRDGAAAGGDTTGRPADPDRDATVTGDGHGGPLAGRLALVTGAARGIGEAVAATLARDGAQVVCLDVPAAGADLDRLARRLGGSALALDITAADAGERITEACPGGVDILVHNAGITRDRRFVNMAADRWSSVLDVNLGSVLRTTDHLLGSGTIRRGGRIVATSSIAGIAGNAGQTNYAASKAGIVGMVRTLGPRAAADHGVTVNAVAPGFIETRMTAAVPFLVRQAGRRLNSLGQGGLPQDVAETVAWLADPASGAVNGQVVRVCGQSLLGA